MINFNNVKILIILLSLAKTWPRWEEANRKPFDKIARFPYPKTMRSELVRLTPSEVSEKTVVRATVFIFIAKSSAQNKRIKNGGIAPAVRLLTQQRQKDFND